MNHYRQSIALFGIAIPSLAIALVLLVVWTAVPAAGALLLGWWLRRELGS